MTNATERSPQDPEISYFPMVMEEAQYEKSALGL